MAKDHVRCQSKEIPYWKMGAVVPSDFHKVSKALGQTSTVPIAQKPSPVFGYWANPPFTIQRTASAVRPRGVSGNGI
jgi:hypothetical protein